MSELHPHWQETDAETVQVRAKHAESEEAVQTEERSMTTVSRKPAAIVGMALVLGAGLVFFHGLDGLLSAQVSGGAAAQKSIRITDTGFVPARVEVEHGDTIAWTNDSTVTHGVISQTLCSNTGFCLQTAPLSKGGRGTFTITPDIPSGTYAYTSSAEPSMQGSIVIVTTATENFENILPASETSPGSIPTNPNALGSNSTDFGSTFNPFEPDSTAVPVNPYTEEGDREHPFDAEGNPIASLFEPLPTQAQQTLQQSKPQSQPSTGAASWMIVAGSICALLIAACHQKAAVTFRA